MILFDRIRPQAPKEVVDMCSVCTSVMPGEPQVCLGKEKAFTFDHVFDTDSQQEQVYSVCVEDLIEGCFDGFNATVLAYGQTGSGKTYTMGSGLEVVGSPQLKGIIPRAIEHLFNGIKVKQQEAKEKGLAIPEFQVTAQFLELYNENIIDLLCQDKKHQIKIHEDKDGNMYLVGATVHPVRSVEETSNFLKMGALSRTTGSTQMNSQSSRSHAIFTLHIKQQRVVDIANENVANLAGAEQEIETLTAKFHFVDLAGSERLKRTGAEGERAKEGISINTGLLALGNVISALGDKSKKATHVPYRDSKLTRFLQDSLGGNSRTLMIACISPSDRDFMETLNTLRYANRAKNIKNKVVANQDKSSQIISVLRAQIQQLELELMEYKQGKRVISDDGTEVVNDMFHENNLLQNEIENLKTRVKALQEANNHLNLKNIELLAEKESGAWITSTSSDENKSDIVAIVQKYMTQIETLRVQLIEKEEECSEIRRQLSQRKALMPYSPGHFPTSPYATTNLVALSGHNDIQSIEQEVDTNEIIEEAKRDVYRMRKKAGKKFKNHDSSKFGHDTNGNAMNGSLKQEPIAEDSTAIVVDLEEDEDTSNEEEDDIFDDEDSKRAQELYDLANEITIKEKLISELEKSQKKLYNLQKHYEEKLSQLQTKICEVEAERDRVLSKLSIGTQSGQSSASITKERQRQERQVRDEYQKKLNNLQSEKKKLEAAKKQHEMGMRNMLQTEQQAKHLRHEVEELKKARVRLMAQMKEQQNKHRDEELKANKKIAQMSKQDRQKELKIRNLQAENNRVQALLRRREEEMRALKRSKPMSDKVAGRVAVPVRQIVPPPPVFKFSARRAKDRWTEFEKIINKIVLSKTTIASHGSQIDRYVNQREAVTHSLARTRRKLERLEREKAPKDIISAVREEMEGLESNLKYLNREIEECQTIVMQLEDNRPEEDELYGLFKETARCPDEALYHFQKVLTLAIDQSMTASLADAEKRETQVKYQELANTSMVNEEILNHVLDRGFLDDGIGYHQYSEMSGDSGGGEVIISNGISHRGYIEVLPPSEELLSHLEASPSLSRRTKGERRSRLTMTHDELVQDTSNPMNTTVIMDRDDPMTRSLVGPATESSNDLHRAPSAPSLKDFPDTTPPASPSMSRKNRDENVFSRLTSGTTTTSVIQPDRGVIGPFTGKAQHDKASPLICTHIAEGHSRAVLSVSATNDVLFTGSKDCTVKIWDLYTGRELQSLVDHPDAVTIVRYNEYSRLAFSVSKSYIKVWDPRDNPARCVKTLNSSGLVHSSLTQHGPKGNELAPGETKIFDIRLSPYGTTLFSTSGPIVRFWDLRMFYCVGKLNTGHQSNITCMAVDEAGVDSNLVITGSKDHYIKIFEVMEGIGGIHNPKSTLTPPHYDGIESLYIHSDYLFSASRDACIKKWDLSNQRLIHSINQAHRDWIQSLAVLPNSHILVSGCRQGFMKLWSTETCHLMADIRAHSQAINCIDTNSQLVFTASGDNTIGLWARRSNGDSPDILE